MVNVYYTYEMAPDHILPEICEGEGAEELDLGPVAAEERGDGSEEARAGLQGRDADHGLDAVRHGGQWLNLWQADLNSNQIMLL